MNTKKLSSKTIRLIRKVVISVVMIMILVVLGIKGYMFGTEVFYGHGMEAEPGTDVVITIPESAGKSLVGEILINNGLIENKSTFNIQCIIFEAEFYAGDYNLNSSQSAEDIIETLKKKPDQKLSEAGN